MISRIWIGKFLTGANSIVLLMEEHIEAETTLLTGDALSSAHIATIIFFIVCITINILCAGIALSA